MKNIKNSIIKNLFTIFIVLAIATMFLGNYLYSKEPTNIMVGVGIGAGYSKLDIVHSHAAKYPIQDWGTTNPLAPLWAPQRDLSTSSWALAWEFLVGYKHFINDWVGFRYYANVGVQHYVAKSLGDKKQNIGFVDYTLNADLLIDFWESEFFAVGMFGGLGFGGTSFDKKAISQYMAVYSAANPNIPIGLADVKKHFLNVNASTGLRLTIFQKYRRTSARVCDKFVNGKRVCRVPIFYIGHGIELSAKFPLLDYLATAQPDIYVTAGANIGTGAGVISRPGYTVSNPYRITLRYVVDF